MACLCAGVGRGQEEATVLRGANEGLDGADAEVTEFLTETMLVISNLLGLFVLFFGADRYITFEVL